MVKQTQRLDKVLSHSGYGTRSELKKLVKQGAVTVNGKTVKDSGLQVNPHEDEIRVNGEKVLFREFIYLMMNKPQGVISATEDDRERTVLDLLEASERHYQPFPVGRLDKDTEGLLLLTNDGALAHQLLSPRKKVPKKYYAEVLGRVDERDKQEFAAGVVLDDGYITLPAELKLLSADDGADGWRSQVELVIHEGKFHQVKRMFQAAGKKVVFLKRLSMGGLELDSGLSLGEYRELTNAELQGLREWRD